MQNINLNCISISRNVIVIYDNVFSFRSELYIQIVYFFLHSLYAHLYMYNYAFKKYILNT
mgnify:CR=1 FL=1